jgi:hypothetical protein
MKKVLFIVGLFALLMLGACTKVGFEGDILGEWELDVFGKEVIMTVTEQGFVTFEAIFDNPDFAFTYGGTSHSGMVGIEIYYKGFAYTLHGNISDNSATMQGFVREGVVNAGGPVVGNWLAFKLP